MGGRTFAIVFLLVVAFGVWFQQAYMTTYSAEFEAQKMGSAFTSELLTIRPFRSQQYRDGVVSSRVSADEGRYFSNGRIVLAGAVKYEDFDEKGLPRMAVETKRALATLQVLGTGGFFDADKKLEQVEIPGDVVITLAGEDAVRTRKVKVDFQKGILETSEVVTLDGPGRSLRGKGLTYNMDTQDFRLGGRVSGELLPPAQTEIQKSNARQKTQSSP
ncbi:MAG: LPS export ABC transporter periplasmic protein LptC [Silvanigrellales bacterium]|nr:LPS export ABC transporter periplasmic protein LptC [Silvanigrellales bacterium]